jgi:hypothetical protein
MASATEETVFTLYPGDKNPAGLKRTHKMLFCILYCWKCYQTIIPLSSRNCLTRIVSCQRWYWLRSVAKVVFIFVIRHLCLICQKSVIDKQVYEISTYCVLHISSHWMDLCK